MAASDELGKLQQHLSLLREQYVRLQERFTSLEQQHAIATANSQATDGEDSFVTRLLRFVADLYDKEKYSDMSVNLGSRDVRAHRFVLAARSDNWGVTSLADVDSLDWSSLEEEVGEAVLRWVYTDHVSLLSEHNFTLNLMRAAAGFSLSPLMKRCEKALMGWVTVRNCVRLYTTADEIGAETLRDHCSTLISTHWNDFTHDDFSHMSAPLLYAMFKSKTRHPLHAAIRLQREDVVFLYLIEFDAQLPAVLDEADEAGDMALDLALLGRHHCIADTLLKHGASVTTTDPTGASLLHRAVRRGDEFSASFLMNHGCSVNVATPGDGRTPLHSLVSQVYEDRQKREDMVKVAQMMIEKGADPNIQDKNMKTVMHLVVEGEREEVFRVLIEHDNLRLELRDKFGYPPLWYALVNSTDFGDASYALLLIKKGASPDAVVGSSGESLLHLVAREGLEEAGLFLTTEGANCNVVNADGETPLHISCTVGLPSLTTALLQIGANPNLQTYSSTPTTNLAATGDPFADDESENGSPSSTLTFRETALHRAIKNKNESDIRAILDHKEYCESNKADNLLLPDLNLRDSDDLTALGVALGTGQLTVAKHLLEASADLNTTDSQGLGLLHMAIQLKDIHVATFLINNGTDVNLRTREGQSPLELCINEGFGSVVALLCGKGADLNSHPNSPEPPLWLALNSKQEDIASILVQYHVDTDNWGDGPDGCLQTLLHKAIDENREDIACFLIRSGCDVNVVRKPGPGGTGGEEATDQQTPLHLCCSWGLEDIVQTLLEHGAKVNAKDCENKTPLHHAIENAHTTIISLLLSHPSLDLTLRDKSGITPFAAAMLRKNNKAAQAILSREPKAAEQYDHKGHNFLHVAIQKKDMESVLFLLSIHVDMHTRTQDQLSLTPLHLATLSGSEMIVRNLLLAGSGAISELTPQKQTVLHLAAAHDHPHLASIFIENGVNVDAVDDNLNNALHVAVKEGHLSLVKVLLTESRINAGAVNLRGQNPLHVLGNYPKENAAAIAEVFLETMPDYDLNKVDVEGNSALLLAYMRGAGQLCRVFVRSGACLGSTNKHGVNIFNYQVPTKTLLFRLLDVLSVEPPWSEGELCMECGAKFGIATRKHHCRHCGRLLCNRCSDKDVPILKFSLNKPVRVCQTCFDVLTLGAAAIS
ncbi:rabankyrin-5-like isoform X2 [Homarus americanus]|uniref:rabankyrin-5-like isoform X2 n=1 Tax=Homarus americanus TaxID=6706 RepID=UPI001C45158B|nr:rabankyrin-5-like isoform X2 [Homarus americanus]